MHKIWWLKTRLLLACVLPLSGYAQHVDPATIKDKMQWYQDAKLGIFIHWGVYSVNGIDESWSFHNRKISYTAYMQELRGFTASAYDPQAWADLIKASGARYAVLTTKHHDGVALWDTRFSDLNVVKRTPAARDVVGPFFAALRKDGIKCGAYFSLLDWSHPDYPGFLKDSSRYKIEDDYARWNRYRHFFQGQIGELMDRYNPDLIWFDGDWEQSAEAWEAEHVRHLILSKNPKTIINGRLQGYGDYETPEQNIPVSRPAYPWWELCYTSNNNWGYHPDDTAFKTPQEIISVFADVLYNGGNLLLDIGPRADGTIPSEETHLLTELGKWTHAHEEAIFGTLPGIPQGHFFGPSTLSGDSATLYLFLPAHTYGPVLIKGLASAIRDVRVVGSGERLSYKVVGKISWSEVPGLVYVDVPASSLDEYMTVLAVRLDGPVRLYRGHGGY
jgi:alpha-L-fucosidase